MPVRIIKEDICSSYSLAVISAEAERLFYRLLTKTDDYGRFDADPQIVMSRCFERPSKDITLDNVKVWMHELAKPINGEKKGMISFYLADGRIYGIFNNMSKHHRKRAKYARYPPPTGDFYRSLDTIRAPKQTELKVDVKKPKPKKKKKDDFTDVKYPKPFGCADFLKNSILNFKPDHKLSKLTKKEWRQSKQRKEWAKEFYYCNTIDERPWTKINLILSWLKYDSFWIKNIQSGKKFRLQFDRLEVDMNEKRPKKKKKRNDGDVDMDDPTWERLA